ncbi:hypothetical protein C8Q70DRAFT_911561 [Cubamyces menziesii]|nr:hypothetical protein C8Q70DRAFT_911561 [Cubamyces menziesii]
MSWEETGQYALNVSILTGRFEDLRLVAMSKRLPSGIVCQPRALYANGALVTRALSNASLCERTLLVGRHSSVINETYATGPLMPYEYIDDSDLEDDDFEDDSDIPKSPMDVTSESGKPTGEETPQAGNQSDHSGPAESHYCSASSSITIPTVSSRNEQGATGTDSPAEKTSELEPSSEDIETGQPAPRVPSPAIEDTTTKPGAKRSGRVLPPVERDETIRTIFSTDTAYRTWRAFIFYAYTRRIAFAPLRSQASNLMPDDHLDDATQLPICSPKSAYRLAVKYGNPELALLAGNDIAAKLSTQNVLEELFSHFTAAHPAVQDMELNFALTYLKHPDITVRLPTWVSRFARGELKECADTLERLIHKLGCATIDPAVSTMCPKGCAMPTIQHRCAMCGWMFH